MLNYDRILERAQHSGFWRAVLNRMLSYMIPFNRPHGFTIDELGDDYLKVSLPYRRNNFNHIKGLHACALATLAEFTTGFMLIRKLDARKYRLIMKKLEMSYHYQGKSDATARFEVTESWLKEKVFRPLQNNEAVEVLCEVMLFDAQQNHLATGSVYWHIKPWHAVRTKV